MEIRLYKLQPNGEPEFSWSNSLSAYGGICPNVGDTLCREADRGRLYRVVERYFFETGTSAGWAILIAPTPNTAHHTAVRRAWSAPETAPQAATAQPEPSVFSPRTLAERWQCSERHIRNMISRGELKAFKHGEKLLRVRLEEVLRVESGKIE